jgi:hypothetical protein
VSAKAKYVLQKMAPDACYFISGKIVNKEKASLFPENFNMPIREHLFITPAHAVHIQ